MGIAHPIANSFCFSKNAGCISLFKRAAVFRRTAVRLYKGLNFLNIKLGFSATFNSVVARRALPLHVRLNFLYVKLVLAAATPRQEINPTKVGVF